MKKTLGFTLMELLVALALVGIIFLPVVEMINRAFIAEYKNRVNIEAKGFRDLSLGRISSILKETSYIYSTSVSIPTPSGSYSVTPGINGVAVLIPVYNDDGEVVRSSGNSEFDAYVYSLVPADQFYEDSSSTDRLLVEAYDSITCATSEDTPAQPSGTCITDFTGGDSNIIFEDAKPGVFLNYSSPFIVSGSDVIKVVFAAKSGQIYYPSTSGTTINAKFVSSTDIFCRNVE